MAIYPFMNVQTFSFEVCNFTHDFNNQQEAEAAWKLTTTVLRKTWHVNQIFELVLEQCVANYYRDNTIAK